MNLRKGKHTRNSDLCLPKVDLHMQMKKYLYEFTKWKDTRFCDLCLPKDDFHKMILQSR